MIEKEVKSQVANVRSKPIHNSILETQLIHGEKLVILSNKNDWSYICSNQDNYKGWIKTNQIGQKTIKTHKIKELSTYVFSKPDHKSRVIINYFLTQRLK